MKRLWQKFKNWFKNSKLYRRLFGRPTAAPNQPQVMPLEEIPSQNTNVATPNPQPRDFNEAIEEINVTDRKNHLVKMQQIQQNNDGLGYFSLLSKDVHAVILGYLISDSFSVFSLALTSKSFFDLVTKHRILQSAYPENKPLNLTTFVKIYNEPLRKMLSHGALGEWEEAEAIWSKNPSLLKLRGTIYHPNRIYWQNGTVEDVPRTKHPGSYKYVEVTLVQIAAMNSEIKEIQRMSKFLSPEALQEQMLECFPDGKMIKYDWDLNKAKELLMNIVTATGKKTRRKKALLAFYDYVKPPAEQRKGLVFDPHLFIEVLRIWESDARIDRSNDFWNNVQGYLVPLLGTRYRRMAAQGIYDDTSYPKLHRRGCMSPHESIYPFRGGYLTNTAGPRCRESNSNQFFQRIVERDEISGIPGLNPKPHSEKPGNNLK